MLSFNGLIIYAYLHSERVHWRGGGRRIWSPDFTLNIRATVQTDQKGAIERFCNLKTADENQKGETEFLIATERRQRCRAGREMAPASPVWQEVASGCTSVITIICRFFVLFCFLFPLGRFDRKVKQNSVWFIHFCRIRSYQNSKEKNLLLIVAE